MFPLGYFSCCFKIYVFCDFWYTYEACIFNGKCTLQRVRSLFSFHGKEVLHLFILICLCHGAHFTTNCTVYTEHYLYILLIWASVSIWLQDRSVFSYSSLFKRWCFYNQDVAAELCLWQSYVLNSEQNGVMEIKLWIQYDIMFVNSFYSFLAKVTAPLLKQPYSLLLWPKKKN